jgi:porphobilinogen synthase
MIATVQPRYNQLMYPLFVSSKSNEKATINSMPNIFRMGQNEMLKEVEMLMNIGLNSFLIFGTGDEKSEVATSSCDPNNSVNTTLRILKKEFDNQIFLTTDVCICAYTTHGHCGLVHNDVIQNQPTLAILAAMALSHAEAGADMIAPSDMMDGRVGAIRTTLDSKGFDNIPIMSYSTKYASAYYGPFREAANSAPGKSDRKSYQMDYRRAAECLTELELDANEGADVIMVKPAIAYLDIIQKIANNTNLPIAAYNVSGEYSMVKAASSLGWIDEQAIVFENMAAMIRAGANIIITYHAKDIFINKWFD